MNENPLYPEARAILFLLLRRAHVPEQRANQGVAVLLDEAAAFAAEHGSAPVADAVVVRDHRSTRLAAENPAMHGDFVEAANKG